MNFKTNMTTSTLLAAGFSLLAGSAAAQTCVANNCATLGFTKSEDNCEGDIIRCPFDTSKVFCKEKEVYVMRAGDILYSDGTTSDSVIASKTPVGIVAYVNDSTRFAVALTESNQNQTWGAYGHDVSCLSYMDSDAASADMNGRVNTQCLVSDSETHPAANYCNTFSAVSSGKGSSGWYLPAAGELKAMSFNYVAINLGLQKLSKTQILSNFYWSSSEGNDIDGYRDAWTVRPSDGLPMNEYKDNRFHVRCVIAF